MEGKHIMPITALYAALLAPLFLFLSVRVIRMRRGERIGVGDGGNADLLRRVRVHANFAEYAPFTLLLLALAESLNSTFWLLHAAGLLLLIGRYAHAYGLSNAKGSSPGRVGGMLLTFTAIGVLALMCGYGALQLRLS
jgi:uncharacterized protein